MKRLKIVCLALIGAVFLMLCVATAGASTGDIDHDEIVRALVLSVEEAPEEQIGTEDWYEANQLVTVELLGGNFKGQVITFNHVLLKQTGYNIVVDPGDQVLVYVEPEGDGIGTAYITDHVRDAKLYVLLGIFIICLLILGGVKGFKSFLSLLVTGAAVLFIMLPLMLKGYSPIWVAVVVGAGSAAVTLVLVGGFGAKTLAAIIGTSGGVVAAGLLALLFGTAANLTGFSSEEMHMLLYIPQNTDFDIRGILFAGMIIGALGAVMDVGMSVASAVQEIKKANPRMGSAALMRSGMNVGRDIMGTMSNTLILAYTGSAVPLLLLFVAYETPYLKIINLDLIATEVVRALAGSIGLILAIPITSFAAAILLGRRSSKKTSSELTSNHN